VLQRLDVQVPSRRSLFTYELALLLQHLSGGSGRHGLSSLRRRDVRYRRDVQWDELELSRGFVRERW
jgi:hypothetical protein